MKIDLNKLIILLLTVIIMGQMGCAVPQKKGQGLCSYQVEPQTKNGYWLYLPEDYVKNNGQHPKKQRWPIVVTFHGLKPYDNAKPQIREWQEEADRYGFIVIAPKLRTCDSLTMQFPLRDPTLPYVQADEKAIVNILDEVCRLTNADPQRVLATSFSSGGYMAHYMVNRYPERFSCLAVRGSNFSEAMLDPTQVPKYRNMKIGIFFGENDLPVCRKENTQAVDWYQRRRFQVVARKIKGLGHQRKPQTAATLFASTIGASPKTPPELGKMVMLNVNQDKTIKRNRLYTQQRPSRHATQRPTDHETKNIYRQPQKPKIIPNPQPINPTRRTINNNPAQVKPKKPISRSPATIQHTPSGSATPKRRTRKQPYTSTHIPAKRTSKRQPSGWIPKREKIKPIPIPARIRIVGKKEGLAPMWVRMSVEMPPKMQEGASILWTDNNKPISTNTFDAKSMLRQPGKHIIQAHIVTADDQQITLSETVNVRNAPATQPAES
ncbi:MAG: PHB depolymerase family esterase [Planctomycetota bacterium]|jgi:poly(3-hydroxybutyrate) depolymerase